MKLRPKLAARAFAPVVLMILASLLSFVFAACTQNPTTPPRQEVFPTGPSTPAHPAWAFLQDVPITVGRTTNYYWAVAVSDSDGTHNTNVYTNSTSDLTRSYVSPTWSATGGSISWIDKPGSWVYGSYSLKAVDVAVSNGVPVGSNVRTIYSRSTSDSTMLREQAWSPVSSDNRLAFVTRTTRGYDAYIISASGGTPTKIFSVTTPRSLGKITWSPDGTKLALGYQDTINKASIKVIDTSGTVLATLDSGVFKAISSLVWSHTGSNTLAISARTTTDNSVTNFYLYTSATTSGSTATQLVQGESVHWSPNNSELSYLAGSTLSSTRKITVSSGSVTTIGSNIPVGDWKQP